jgi:hypothetical protein
VPLKKQTHNDGLNRLNTAEIERLDAVLPQEQQLLLVRYNGKEFLRLKLEGEVAPRTSPSGASHGEPGIARCPTEAFVDSGIIR